MKILDTRLTHPAEQIILILERIYNRGLTTTSGGNISIIDDRGDIWITPAGVDKGSLQTRDIMCIKNDGTVVGIHKPSSEFPFHRAIYEFRPDIRAVIHAHPPALVSFSIVGKIPDTNIIPQARKICGPIGYAPYALPGSQQLGNKIADVFKENHEAVIMENHGTVVGGTDLRDAFQRFETLEFCARTIINGRTIGKPEYLDDRNIEEFHTSFPPLLSEMDKVEYPSEEREIRQSIVRIVQRACRQGLMISSYGTVSVRWKREDFLITPTNLHRWDIRNKDVVQIREGMREPGKIPSNSTWLHQEIYKRFPNINSIIITQSPYLMAFGVTREEFNVRTIPESWIFLQDVPKVPFGSYFKHNPLILTLLGKGIPAVIVENDAVMVTGDKLLQTFDRLEVAEFSAKSLTMSVPLGKLKPINARQIGELQKKFLPKG